MNKLFDVLEILGFPVEIDAKFDIHNGDIWNSVLVKKSIKHAGNLITIDLPIPGHMVKFACTLLKKEDISEIVKQVEEQVAAYSKEKHVPEVVWETIKELKLVEQNYDEIITPISQSFNQRWNEQHRK